MKLDVPLTINGFACIINDGESICFGGADLECLDCEYKDSNGCGPVMIELVPSEEWADRKLRSMNEHTAYQEALNSLQYDIENLKKSLENIGGDK